MSQNLSSERAGGPDSPLVLHVDPIFDLTAPESDQNF